jgi:formylglycine-generating enzyme required for sulfatase activity
MKRLLHLLSVLLVAALLPACSKKPVDVTGQIFVVTKSRENIKMGGLEVLVIPDDEFQIMAKTTVSWMQEESRAVAQRKIDSDHMTAFIREVMDMERESPCPIPELEKVRMSIVEESGTAKTLLESALAGDLLLKGFGKLISSSTSSVKVSTDADGRFAVPLKGKTWFIAGSQREVGDETEHYLWLKSYEPIEGAATASMSISNESDIQSEEELYKILASVLGSSGDLQDFQKVEVSEKMKTMVAKYRELAKSAKEKAEREAAEAKAKAEREAAEAKAKAEREVAEAKAKAERDASEAKAKLTAEIGAGRVGATLGVPLPRKMVIPFAYCPAGSFMMGSPSSENDRRSNENQVRVTITKGFWMAKTELTQAQWTAIMSNNPSNFNGNDLPVESVSWEDTQEFIKKVNDSGVIPKGWKIALPTEAQWEYACRAGETGAYSGGTIDQVAWYKDNSGSITHNVGTKKPNAWGLYDMHGNVRELCADLSANFSGDTLPGGADPYVISGVYPNSRGGWWGFDAKDCRAAVRSGFIQGIRTSIDGFRPALVPSEQQDK